MAKSSSTIQIYQKSESSSVVKAEINSKTANSSETPTPTISQPPPPQSQDAFNNSSDIVRIYVPPAADMIMNDVKSNLMNYQRDRGDDEVSQCSNRSSIVHVEYETLPYDISPTHSNGKKSSDDFKSNYQEQGEFFKNLKLFSKIVKNIF
jgi:hypothetical protein